jgi:flagellar protein FliO/FliZ
MAAADLLQFAAALILVLALIGLSAVAARRFGLAQGGRRGAPRRLAIVEVLPVDARRRLVLVRCDADEHLLLLGPGSERLLGARHHPPLAHSRFEDGSLAQQGGAP